LAMTVDLIRDTPNVGQPEFTMACVRTTSCSK
jgi:hypothetical protein